MRGKGARGRTVGMDGEGGARGWNVEGIQCSALQDVRGTRARGWNVEGDTVERGRGSAAAR